MRFAYFAVCFWLAGVGCGEPDASLPDSGSRADANVSSDAGGDADALPVDAQACATATVTASAPDFAQSSSISYTFAAPTGQFAVGTHRVHLVDESRSDDLTPEPDDRRELMIQVYYPTELRGGPPAPLMENEVARVLAPPGSALAPDFHTHVLTHATYDAPLSTARARWPVILYSHSLGGYRFEREASVEQLASEGAIVVTVSHPRLSGAVVFPDGRVVLPVMVPQARTPQEIQEFYETVSGWIDIDVQDLQFVLDTLEGYERGDECNFLSGHLDLSKLGSFGFSLGGAVSVALCLRDERCQSAVDLDGGLFGDYQQATDKPLMMMLSERSAPEFEAVIDRSSGTAYRVRLADALHGNFHEIGPLIHALIPRASLAALGLGTIDPERAATITRSYVDAFFGEHVFGTPSDLLASARSPYGGVFAEKSVAGRSEGLHQILGFSRYVSGGRALPVTSASVAISAEGLSTATSSTGEWILDGVADDTRVALTFDGSPIGRQLLDLDVRGRSLILDLLHPTMVEINRIAQSANVTPDPSKGNILIAASRTWMRELTIGPAGGVMISLASGAQVDYLGPFGVDDGLVSTSSTTYGSQAAAFDVAEGIETVSFTHPSLDCAPVDRAPENSADLTIRAGYTTFLSLVCR